MESRSTITFSTKHSQFSLLTEYLPLTSHTNAIAVILKTLCDTLMILLATLRLRLFGISDKLQTSKSQVSSALMGVTKTKTLENEDLRPKTHLSFRDFEN